MLQSSQLAIIETTYSSIEEARKCAKNLVQILRLAACCHIYPSVQTLYVWEEKMCEGHEVIVRIKTDKTHLEQAVLYVKSTHSYINPEITITLCDFTGSEAYESWIINHTKPCS